MSNKPDIDFTIGFFVIVVAFINWCISVYFGVTTFQPIFAIGAVVSLIWFLFAPVYISRALDIEQWTFSKWGNSIWSTIMWHRYIERGGGKE